MNRREMLAGLIGLSTPGLIRPQEQVTPSAQLKPLPFEPTKLRGLSEKLITSHHQNNYAVAFRRLQQIESQLKSLPTDAPGFQLKGLKMEELIATNSVILHEEYFGNLGGDGKASGSLQPALTRQFKSFDLWEQEFRATSNALGGGSGWAILSFHFGNGTLHNYIAFDHTDNVAFGRPILVNDMFEHSYHMDYGTQAARYVDAVMQNINWEECNRRFEEATKVYASLKR